MPVVLILNAAGRPKRDIIEMMREFCGQAGFEFELTPEEVASDLRLLDTMMAEWPWSELGYSAASYGSGLPEDISGIAEADVPAVFMHLALRRAPGLGASLPPEAAAAIARSYNFLVSRVATVPTALISVNTPRGMGRRRFEPYISEYPAT